MTRATSGRDVLRKPARTLSAQLITWLRRGRSWELIAALGIGIAVGVLPRSGSSALSDLLAFAGALVGAGASVAAAFFAIDRTRDLERQERDALLIESLQELQKAMQPFVAITEADVEKGGVALTKGQLLEAHEQRWQARELLEFIADDGSRYGAKTWMSVLAIIRALDRSARIWSAEEDIVQRPRVTTGVLWVHISKLKASANELHGLTGRALRLIDPAPQGRSLVVEADAA